MTRKVLVLATVTLFGVSAVLAGAASSALACDDNAKTKTASATPSCCAKDGAKTASVDAKKVHNSAIKSAVVAPGAAPILNIAAFGGMLAAGSNADCDWCPGASASACATKMSSAECAAMKGTAVQTASYDGAIAAPTHKSGCEGAATTASLNTTQSAASMTMAAGGEGCTANKTANAGAKHGEAGCCESNKTASAAGAKGDCTATKTASLKGKVDEMPYRENKRVVLAGAYACGHCSLEKTADCSPMLKTADGKVYPLLENNQAKQMKAAEGKNLEVSGTVKKVDGVKFLDVKSYKVM
jgi:hypothetical protein